MKKIALIDAYGFVFRAFHSLPSLSRSDGTPVGAVYGFTNMLIKLLASLDVSHIAVVFDSGSKTFRNEIYSAYKANRPPCPEELKPQFPLVRICAESLNLPVLEKVGFEADDIIATIAKKSAAAGLEVLIVSSDKDLMQLVDDQIQMFDAMKNRLISKHEVKEKFLVEPNQVLDVLSLIGDASDNIPGVKGIGPKTAAELISEFKNLENLLGNLDQIKQEKRRELLIAGKDRAILSKKLASLETNVDLKIALSDLEIKAIDPEKLINFLHDQDFRSLILKVKKEFATTQNSNHNLQPSKQGFDQNSLQKNQNEINKNKTQTSDNLTNKVEYSTAESELSHAKIFSSKQKFNPEFKKLQTIADLKNFHQIAQKNGQITLDFLTKNDEFVFLTLSSSDNFEVPSQVFWFESTENIDTKTQLNIDKPQNQKADNLPDVNESIFKRAKSFTKTKPIQELPLFAEFLQDSNTDISSSNKIKTQLESIKSNFQSKITGLEALISNDYDQFYIYKSEEEAIIFEDFLGILCDESIRKIIFDGKVFLRGFKEYFRFKSPNLSDTKIIFDDVKLQNYLLNSSIKNDLRSLIDSNLDLDFEEFGFGEILEKIENEFSETELFEGEENSETNISTTKNLLKTTRIKPAKIMLNEIFLDKIKNADSAQKLDNESEAVSLLKSRFLSQKNLAIFQLSKLFTIKLLHNSLFGCYFNYELPLIPVLAKMEFNGIRIDSLKMMDLSNEFAKKIEELSSKIYEIAGEKFNIASNKQINYILFEKLGLEPSKKSKKTGAPSTKARVLDELAEEGYEIAVLLREFRKFSKLKNTYTDALPKAVNPQTNRIHSHFSNLSTLTGRLSSSHPNLQNIPIKSAEGKKIRELFIADEGNVLIAADYSQIELRVIAHLAEVSELILAFKNDRDIHLATAAEVFQLNETQVSEELRQKAKAINFGIIYGISAFGLARQLKISTGEASAYINSYLKTYPGIAEFMDKQVELAQKQGFVQTISGRKCFIRNIHHKNRFIRSEAERQALNAPVQGSAADIIKKAMIRLQKRIEDENLPIKLILQIHDELVIETKADFADIASQILKQEMERSYELLAPLKVDISIKK